MNEFLMSLDWDSIWNLLLVPLFTWIASEVHVWAKSRRIDNPRKERCSCR